MDWRDNRAEKLTSKDGGLNEGVPTACGTPTTGCRPRLHKYSASDGTGTLKKSGSSAQSGCATASTPSVEGGAAMQHRHPNVVNPATPTRCASAADHVCDWPINSSQTYQTARQKLTLPTASINVRTRPKISLEILVRRGCIRLLAGMYWTTSSLAMPRQTKANTRLYNMDQCKSCELVVKPQR